MKISIIGAGNVGATAAQMIAKENLADEIVILDVREGVAEGKAMDIMQSMMNAPRNYIHDATAVVRGVTNDYTATTASAQDDDSAQHPHHRISEESGGSKG